MITSEQRRELQDAIREVLKILGDLDDIEKRIIVLKKKTTKLYDEIDDALDKGKY